MKSIHRSGLGSQQKRGSLTVWCVLTLIPGAVLFLSILMLCRYRIEGNDAGRIAHVSGKAALSFYDGPLCDRYGLYGTPGTQIEEHARFFLEQNRRKDHRYLYRNPVYLLFSAVPFPSLFQYEIEQVQIVPGSSLQNSAIFMKQIREAMGYRIMGELVSFLSQQIDTIGKNQKQNGGIEASFSLIQQELSQYQQLYSRLSKDLYSDWFTIGVDRVSDSSANPERIVFLLDAVSRGMEQDQVELRSRLKWWQAHLSELIQRHQDAIEVCSELGEAVQTLKKEIVHFEQLAGKLSEEERKSDQKKNMIQSVSKLQKELWGTRGEIAGLIRMLNDNQAILSPLEVKIFPVFQQLSTLQEISPSDIFALKSAFEQFSGYSTSFDLKKTEGTNLLDFLGVSKWLKNYYVDLSPYASDLDLFDEEEIFLMDDPYSIQQQVSSQMDFFQNQSLNIGILLEDQVYLCEYGICAFRNLSDTIGEEDGIWPVDLHGDPFGKTLLRNEAEYLIHGSWNEYRNVSDVQVKIIALRTMMNMAFLMANPGKSAILHSVADPVNLVIPVIGGIAAYTALALTWGLAEAYLDYTALIQGEEIPLWKTEDSWQSDLQGILKKSSAAMKLHLSKEEKKPNRLEKLLSMDYEMYLRLLLMFTPREELITRMQNLIDLNLRKAGNPAFSLSNMVTDYSMRTEIRGHYGIYGQKETFSFYPLS